jgi:hypothetical protein
MAAFKQFTTTDVVITPFNADKGFNFTGTALTASDVGIEVYYGYKPSSDVFSAANYNVTGLVALQNTTGVYHSIKQLYYSNYLTSSTGDDVPLPQVIPGVSEEYDRYEGAINAPRYENYLQSSLSQSRYFPTASNQNISVVSVPAKLYGENIVPFTFDLTYSSSIYPDVNIIDDGNGNLTVNSIENIPLGYYGTGSYGSSSYAYPYEVGDIVGQIFYSHGIATFTTGALANLGEEISSSLSNLDNLQVKFSSSITIYENQYKCVIGENEFGYSLNKSLLSGSLDDVYYDFVSGSTFNPYTTTVGLYNEQNELLVVGKLSFPVPISPYTDTTIIVNFDT